MSWLEHTTVKNLVYFHQKLGKKCTFFYCSAKYKKRETGKWVGGNRVYGEVQFQLNRHCLCQQKLSAWAPNLLKVLPKVHSLPQFCFCPDMYNSWASTCGRVFSFPVHPRGAMAGRHGQLGEGCAFSKSISTPCPSPGSSIPQPSAESQGPGCGHSLFYNCASLHSDKVNGAFYSPHPREMGMRSWAPEKKDLV